ncbi:hypothetical protein [Actinomadura sp. 3N508]
MSRARPLTASTAKDAVTPHRTVIVRDPEATGMYQRPTATSRDWPSI